MRKRLYGGVMAGVLTAGGLLTMGPWQSQAVPAASEPSRSAEEAAPPGGKAVTATLFERPFTSVAQECKDTLGPAGYGYVEVSPATEHITGDQWWTSYQPVSYKIAGRLGDESDFKSMVNACHEAGVKVVADAVINHMSAGSGTGTGGTEYAKYDYPGTYGDADFHGCRKDIQDYTNREDVQNCELVGLSDLDTGSDQVRSTIAKYLDRLRELGVDGFRIDAAKHMAAQDVEAIKGKMADPGYWVSEVIAGENEAVRPEEYTGLGDVDEFRYGTHLKSAFQGGDLGGLGGIADGKLDSGSARTFVDNWDTERNGSTLTYKDAGLYKLANTFMLAHPYGSPNVYSGYEWSEKDAGPPSGGDGWTQMHADPQITGMVGFRNAVGDAELSDWWAEGGALAFSRAGKGFVALNSGDGELKRTFATSLPAGAYCNVAQGTPEGGCEGDPVKVGDDGKAEVTVPAGGAVALHTEATG
ncbi:alpha-amylase family glycosyl hydrolase [Streptomyces sp. HNM0574]|uniref:alpha-amylase family glycosyl hydrolase n=1 Tax=Streptomyces sp. HNM0574 TaxID=2714954 RepID=UPI00146F03EA|nr:alpha-amylase family glycosyl hydrolase [Streptomyces sp. HNM0574]NLU68749.1 glycosidase [Streptomyces sp. HNM0574]